MHRMHHAFADTEKDPAFSKIRPKSNWQMMENENIYQQINKQKLPLKKIHEKRSQWKSFDKFASSW